MSNNKSLYNSYNSSRSYNPNVLENTYQKNYDNKKINNNINSNYNNYSNCNNYVHNETKRYRSNEKNTGFDDLYIPNPSQIYYNTELYNISTSIAHDNSSIQSSYHNSDPLRLS